MNGNILIIVLVIVFAIALIFSICPSGEDGYDGDISHYETDFAPIGSPRFIGDYMDYVGEVPSEGGYVLESDTGNGESDYHLEASLCQECMNNCVGLAAIHGLRGAKFNSAKQRCQRKCNEECTFSTGF